MGDRQGKSTRGNKVGEVDKRCIGLFLWKKIINVAKEIWSLEKI